MIENIEVFTQNSIRVRGCAGTIYVDPFQMKEEPYDADFILITHEHYDHFSRDDIAKVARDHTVLVVPEKMRGKADEAADLVNAIRPEVAIPTHYGSIVGRPEDADVFSKMVDPLISFLYNSKCRRQISQT